MFKRGSSSSGGGGPRRAFRSGPSKSNGGVGGSRGGRRGPSRFQKTTGIDPARFINKATAVEDEIIFEPHHSFDDFEIDAQLKQAIINKKYTQPTPIQDQAIPHLLAGKDFVGIANTGTGKTAAFLIPLINKVKLNPREQVLIMAPTRELAIQIDEELRGFARLLRIWGVCCVGGMSIVRQMEELRRPYNFIIGTPGRIKDLINRRKIDLRKFNSVVLDEADRMLDMGFIGDIREILSGVPKERQTLLFTATLPKEIEALIKDFVKDPVRVSVKTRETAESIEQDVIRTQGKDKVEVLYDLLVQVEYSKVLVFGRTKHGVEKLTNLLVSMGLKADSIHGNKNHNKRQRALNLFKQNKVNILVATDVAARGLDIPDVTHVINFEIPETYDDYVHRIGRTGRGNKKGKALTFI